MNPGVYVNGWVGGMNSGLPPWQSRANQYCYGENIMCRGGFPVTRPGMRVVASIFGKVPQGFCSFTPKSGVPYLVVAVDGIIYAARPPFTQYNALEGIQFSATAPIINFCSAIKAVTANPDGTKTIIDPKPVLMIQDDQSRAGSWDGTIAKQINPQGPPAGTPEGLWMAWASDRLWVARGSQVFVSDIDDPEGFTENVYLSQRSNFALPGNCTGMLETTDKHALLVFTDSTTTAFQSYIRERAQWQQTTDFQRIVLDQIGCVSGRSPANQHGLSQWYSRSGLTSLDATYSELRSSRITVQDWQMQRSKTQLAPDLSGVCTASFENMLLVSVPVADKWNSETWARDQTPVASGDSELSDAWAGVWTGIRPVQWAKIATNGRERLFALSYDKSTKDSTNIHIWEAFRLVRDDNGARISCQFETGALRENARMDFKYAELDLAEILGTVNLRVYVGGMAGPWIKILDTVLEAEEGPFIDQVDTFDGGTTLKSYKPQVRNAVKTEEFTSQLKAKLAESDDTAGTDKAFQLLVEWEGQMAVMGIRMVAIPNTKNGDQGRAHKTEAGETNIVTELGDTIPA